MLPGNSPLQGYLLVSLTRVKSNSLSLGLTLKGCDQHTSGNVVNCPVIKPLLNDQLISFQTSSKEDLLYTSQRRSCIISSPYNCTENETCRQIGTTSLGECVCLPEMSLSDGVCSQALEEGSTEEIPSSPEPTKSALRCKSFLANN